MWEINGAASVLLFHSEYCHESRYCFPFGDLAGSPSLCLGFSCGELRRGCLDDCPCPPWSLPLSSRFSHWRHQSSTFHKQGILLKNLLLSSHLSPFLSICYYNTATVLWGRLSLTTPWSEGEHVKHGDKSYGPADNISTHQLFITGAWNLNLVFDLRWWYWWFLCFAVLDLYTLRLHNIQTSWFITYYVGRKQTNVIMIWVLLVVKLRYRMPKVR